MKGPMDSMSNANKGNKGPNHPSNHSSNHSSKDVDFSEYVWMGEEMEDFDRKVLADLYEEEFIEQCFEEMLEEEESEWFYPENKNEASELAAEMAQLSVHSQQQQQTSTDKNKQGPAGDSCNVQSTLNPDAPEFVPRSFVNPEVEQAR